ncbi:MAG: glycoside hydrolase family 9 protein, partial [Gammaproteobacteria bacterium]|nr:glycoside hydrolase family 9 protein [Gammaproteobacteria bacterium]
MRRLLTPLLAGLFILSVLLMSPLQAVNLLFNSDFEQPLGTEWSSFGGAALGSIARSPTAPHAGLNSLLSSSRTQTYVGPAQDLLGKLTIGETYDISAWIKLASASTNAFDITIKQVDGLGTRYFQVDHSGAEDASVWIKMFGQFTYQPTGTVTTLTLYINGPDIGVDFYLDDVAVNTPVSYSAPTSSNAQDFVRASGTQLIVGASNTPIRLVGTNFRAYNDDVELADTVYNSKNYEEVDYQRVAGMGLNVVRLNLWWKLFEDEVTPYSYKLRGWQWLEKNILAAKHAGIYLILDMHAPVDGNQGPGYDGGPFWTTLEMRDRTTALWVEIAKRYKNEPVIAAYDLINEPDPLSDLEWQTYAQSLTDAIRVVDNNHLLIVEHSFAADAAPFLINDSNVMYDFHWYYPWRYNAAMIYAYGYGDYGLTYPDAAGNLIPWNYDLGAVSQNPVIPTGSTPWTYYQGTLFTVSDPSIATASPLFVSNGESGKLWFDDFVVEEFDAAGNFVRSIHNIDIETRPANVYLLETFDPLLSFNDAWIGAEVTVGSAAAATRTDEATGHVGSTSLSLSAATGSYALGNSNLMFAVKQGFQYRISGWMKGDAIVGGSGSLGLQWQHFKSWDTPKAFSKPTLEAALLGDGLQFAIDNNVPLNVGEFGTSVQNFNANRGGLNWVTDMLDLFQQYGVNAQYFDYHSQVFGIYSNLYGYPKVTHLNNVLVTLFQTKLPDLTPPLITTPNNILVAIPSAAAQTAVSLGSATAVDVNGATLSNNAPAGFPVGASTVIWTAVDANNNSSSSTQTVTVGVQTAEALNIRPIKVDQFGYLPNSKKIAVISNPINGFNNTVPLPFTPTAATLYELRDAVSNATVPNSSGIAVAWSGGAVDATSGDQAWWFDFSSVTATGDYYVIEPLSGIRSANFHIGVNVYREVLKQTVRSFFYQRVGQAKSVANAGANWSDAASHTADATALLLDPNDPLSENISTARDLSGGWYDAGDYNKYVNYADGTLHNLLLAYEENPTIWGDDYNIPESNNGTPDLLDEIKWELDWLLRMQYNSSPALAEYGSVLHKVSSRNHAIDRPTTSTKPSADTQARFYAPATASATISAAGAYAHAAIVYKGLSDPAMQAYGAQLQAAAINAWSWLLANPAAIPSGYGENGGTGFRTAAAEDCTNGNCIRYQKANRLAAAIYLFAATNDVQYHTYVLNNIHADVRFMDTANYDDFLRSDGVEAEVQDALLYYTSLAGADVALVSEIKGLYLGAMNKPLQFVPFSPLIRYQEQLDPYRSYLERGEYRWGNNKVKSNAGNMMMAARLHGVDIFNQNDFYDGAADYLHYLHGTNALGQNYLSNMGAFGAEKSVSEFYHQWFVDGSDWDNITSIAGGPPPGFLVGGAVWGQSKQRYSAVVKIDGVLRLAEQPAGKSYRSWNTALDNAYEVTENGIYYQAAYVRLLAHFMVDNTPTVNVTLVPKGATWKYLDDSSDQGTAWRAIGFNDAAWASGPAQLGFGGGDEATVTNAGVPQHVTTYFRHSFTVQNPTEHLGMLLELLRDDGAVVYLNGTEVVRSNLPVGVIDFSTIPNGNIDFSGANTFYPFELSGSLLVAGTNVIAVEMLQYTPTSLDLSFDLALNSVVQPVTGDTISPVITLLGNSPQAVEAGTAYVEAGATASDNLDGNISASIVITGAVNTAVPNNYTMTYTVSDAAGNSATTTRTVTVSDTTVPVITLLGTNPQAVEAGTAYVEAGATASDNLDGNISASIVITGAVNTAVPNNYTITYTVSDAAGNSATTTRTVTVSDTTVPVITLLGTNPQAV